jgi:hypothetical protein
MAGNLTDTAEDRGLNWLTGNTTTAPTLPLKVALVTAAGSDSSAGTEVTGGSYARQTIAFTTSSGGATSNSAAVTWSNMPAATVVGAEVWDSATTPVRWWYGPLAASKTLQAGDSFQFAIGDFDLSID